MNDYKRPCCMNYIPYWYSKCPSYLSCLQTSIAHPKCLCLEEVLFNFIPVNIAWEFCKNHCIFIGCPRPVVETCIKCSNISPAWQPSKVNPSMSEDHKHVRTILVLTSWTGFFRHFLKETQSSELSFKYFVNFCLVRKIALNITLVQNNFRCARLVQIDISKEDLQAWMVLRVSLQI